MRILTYRRHWRMRVPPQASWLSLVNQRDYWVMRAHRTLARCMRLTNAGLEANGVVQWLPWKSPTICRSDLRQERNDRLICTPPANWETFCEKINASTASGGCRFLTTELIMFVYQFLSLLFAGNLSEVPWLHTHTPKPTVVDYGRFIRTVYKTQSVSRPSMYVGMTQMKSHVTHVLTN